VGADRDKSPAEIQREARVELERIKAERKAAEILRKAQRREQQG